MDQAAAQLGRLRGFRLVQIQDLLATAPLGDEGARQQVHQALLSGAQSALADVVLALARIHEGRYGTCLDCGGPMAPERLRALPMARWCEGCQRRRETSFPLR